MELYQVVEPETSANQMQGQLLCNVRLAGAGWPINDRLSLTFDGEVSAGQLFF